MNLEIRKEHAQTVIDALMNHAKSLDAGNRVLYNDSLVPGANKQQYLGLIDVRAEHAMAVREYAQDLHQMLKWPQT